MRQMMLEQERKQKEVRTIEAVVTHIQTGEKDQN